MLSHFSCIRLCATLWTVICQVPLNMGFSRQETGVGSYFLLQGIFLTQRSNLCLLQLLHWQVVPYHQRHQGSPLWDICVCMYIYIYIYIAIKPSYKNITLGENEISIIITNNIEYHTHIH